MLLLSEYCLRPFLTFESPNCFGYRAGGINNKPVAKSLNANYEQTKIWKYGYKMDGRVRV